MPENDRIIGLDIGSSSVRAGLFDHTGSLRRNTLVKIERKLKATADGGSELDPDGAFRQVVQAIDGVVRAIGSSCVSHAAMCTFWHSLIGIDEKGIATTPVYGWADNRSRDHVKTLRKRFDEIAVHNRTGARLHSSFWPAKLLWLKKDNPDVWKRTSQWISFSDYIALRLFGATSTSISMASATGLFDLRRCVWDVELLKFLRLKPANLPPIAESEAGYKRLNSRFARRWPELRNAEWIAAIGDGAANNIGEGCVNAGKAVLMIGTSGAIRVAYTGDPPANIPPGLWCYRIDRDRVIVGGALSDGGGLLDWLRANLNLPKNAESIIAKRLPEKSSVTVEPFFAGERSTGYDENARGAILGLTMANDAVDIYQAAMEAVARGFAEILLQIETILPIGQIIGSGGALKHSPVWRRIVSGALGREITLSSTPEASMRGAVLLALETIGKIQITDPMSNG